MFSHIIFLPHVIFCLVLISNSLIAISNRLVLLHDNSISTNSLFLKLIHLFIFLISKNDIYSGNLLHEKHKAHQDLQEKE